MQRKKNFEIEFTECDSFNLSFMYNYICVSRMAFLNETHMKRRLKMHLIANDWTNAMIV